MFRRRAGSVKVNRDSVITGITEDVSKKGACSVCASSSCTAVAVASLLYKFIQDNLSMICL